LPRRPAASCLLKSGGKPPHSKSVLQLCPMDDAPPRQLKERTEKHRCIKCLSEVPRDEYLRNDFLCDKCAEEELYPLQSTPDARKG
jgi:hypothetical protein